MSLIRRKKSTHTSPEAKESTARAVSDLEAQREQYTRDQETIQRISDALERNHLAELFYQALVTQRKAK